MDSVGALLTKRGSVDAEAHRRALMVGEPPADVRVWLARPAARSVPIEEARQLSPQVLQDAIPLRNADAVAVPLRADERRREEVRVAFGASGAQLVLRRRGRIGVELVATAGAGHGGGRATLVSDPLPHRSGGEAEAAEAAEATPPPPAAPPIDCEEDEGLAIEAENPDDEYDNLDALLATYEDGGEPDPASVGAGMATAGGSERDAEAVVVGELDALFAARAGAMLDLPIPPARTPKLLERAQVPTYVLPDWLTEAVATAFQEIGRVTAVLSAAAPPGASVALAVERATLAQHHDRKVETDVRTVTRLQLHALGGHVHLRRLPGAGAAQPLRRAEAHPVGDAELRDTLCAGHDAMCGALCAQRAALRVGPDVLYVRHQSCAWCASTSADGPCRCGSTFRPTSTRW